MTWNLYHTSTPSGTVAAVGAGQVLFENWTDSQGAIWSVVGGGLQAATAAAYATSLLTRPSGEDRQEQRVVATFTLASAGNILVVLRHIDANNLYIFEFNGGGNAQLYKYAGGALTQVGTDQPFTFTAGHTYTLDASATGVNPTTLSVTIIDATTSTTLINAYSQTDSTAALQTTGGYALDSNGTSNAKGISRIDLYNADAVSMAASPSTVNAGQAGQTVTLTGTGTAWTGGTSFSLSGVAGCSITSTVVNGATSATLTLTTGTTTGTLTIGDSSDAATATVGVAWPDLTVAVNDANLLLSPYNWFVSGSSYAQTNCAGASLRLWFQAGAGVTLHLDTTPLAGAAAGSYPTLAWSIDGAAFSSAQLTSGQTTLSLGTLSAGSHTLFLYVKSNAASLDRWNFSAAPYLAVKLTGLVLAGGSTQPLVQTAQPRGGRLLVYGDSIGEGQNAAAAGSHDAFLAFGFRLAEALDAEVGIVAYGGVGWQRANATTNVPAFSTSGDDAQSSWNKYWSGVSRLSGGLLTPAPDYVVVVHGTNDGTNGIGDSSVTTQATAFLAALRAAAGASCKIVLCVPPGRFKKSALAAATLPDARVKLIDLGQEQAIGLTDAPAGDGAAAGAAGWKASDGLHPLATTHAQIGARLAQAIARAFTAQRVGTGGGANA